METLVMWLIEQLTAAGFYGGIGLLVGWNVLPQPAVVKKYYDLAKAKLLG